MRHDSYRRSRSRSEDRDWDHKRRDRRRSSGGKDDEEEEPAERSMEEEEEEDENQPKKMGSSIGAVIKREKAEFIGRKKRESSPPRESRRKRGDDGYDPEALLKNALKSQVKVPEKPKRTHEANKNLLLKAFNDADKSIKERKRPTRAEEKKEIDDIHEKRRKLTQAMRAGKLDEEKLQEISKGESKQRRKEEEREEKRVRRENR